ncbi:hypothetical protein BBF96_09685 [Anoxybacter fermentans]|uniref:FAD-binding PCMH-type domain-containing protein n=1 Tax=Anoxybacter fermentans TaxID=1323375 RepID=A0A3S9SZB9_9FIRM|nr:xanthine dehydrogenase family protein subunit M [Anoxybacter fermentans]AZR73634.1 hypothetical protein BBF96_09685 [Anoxybacter fermentans]
MKNFEFSQPTTLKELLDLLAREKDYQLLAGGTDLLVKWKRGQSSPKNVVNLKQIQELNFLSLDEKGLEIGALVKIADLIKNSVIQEKYPALIQSAKAHSSPLIRNLATVVGNVCNASPAADLVPALLVYDAKVKIRMGNEERYVELKDFFVGPGQTILKQGELVISIFIPMPSAQMKSYFLKEGKRKAHEIAVANCAVSYLNDDSKISDLKVALGAVAPKPLLITELDWFTEINNANLNRLSQLVKETVSPITDQRSTDWYRREVIQVLVKRAITLAQSV